MTDLSPAAQAVLDAINEELNEAPWDVSFLASASAAAALRDVINAAVEAGGGYGRATPVLHARIAAAFRAVADQAHPKAHIEDINYVHQNYVDGWKDALDVILAIADELEAQ